VNDAVADGDVVGAMIQPAPFRPGDLESLEDVVAGREVNDVASPGDGRPSPVDLHPADDDRVSGGAGSAEDDSARKSVVAIDFDHVAGGEGFRYILQGVD
jgi:hypothetical protein